MEDLFREQSADDYEEYIIPEVVTPDTWFYSDWYKNGLITKFIIALPISGFVATGSFYCVVAICLNYWERSKYSKEYKRKQQAMDIEKKSVAHATTARATTAKEKRHSVKEKKSKAPEITEVEVQGKQNIPPANPPVNEVVGFYQQQMAQAQQMQFQERVKLLMLWKMKLNQAMQRNVLMARLEAMDAMQTQAALEAQMQLQEYQLNDFQNQIQTNLGDDEHTKQIFNRFLRIIERHDRNRPDQTVPPMSHQQMVQRAEEKLYNYLMKKSDGVSDIRTGHTKLEEHLARMNINYEDITGEAYTEFGKTEPVYEYEYYPEYYPEQEEHGVGEELNDLISESPRRKRRPITLNGEKTLMMRDGYEYYVYDGTELKKKSEALKSPFAPDDATMFTMKAAGATAYSYYYDDEAGATKKESQPLIEGVYQQGDKKDAADIHVYGAADKDIDIHVYGAAGKDEKVDQDRGKGSKGRRMRDRSKDKSNIHFKNELTTGQEYDYYTNYTKYGGDKGAPFKIDDATSQKYEYDTNYGERTGQPQIIDDATSQKYDYYTNYGTSEGPSPPTVPPHLEFSELSTRAASAAHAYSYYTNYTHGQQLSGLQEDPENPTNGLPPPPPHWVPPHLVGFGTDAAKTHDPYTDYEQKQAGSTSQQIAGQPEAQGKPPKSHTRRHKDHVEAEQSNYGKYDYYTEYEQKQADSTAQLIPGLPDAQGIPHKAHRRRHKDHGEADQSNYGKYDYYTEYEQKQAGSTAQLIPGQPESQGKPLKSHRKRHKDYGEAHRPNSYGKVEITGEAVSDGHDCTGVPPEYQFAPGLTKGPYAHSEEATKGPHTLYKEGNANGPYTYYTDDGYTSFQPKNTDSGKTGDIEGQPDETIYHKAQKKGQRRSKQKSQ